MKIKRTAKVLILSIFCMSILGTAAAAVPQDPLSNMNVTITSSTAGLTGIQNSFYISESSGYSVFTGTTTGTSAATSVSVSVVVEQLSGGLWRNVPNTYHYAYNPSSRIVAVEGERFLHYGYWYRLKSVHTAFVDGVPQTETLYSNLKWHN